MKSLLVLLIIVMAFAMIAVFVYAQTGTPPATTSPISQPLIREGTLAVKLANDLKLGTTDNEAEAEDLLSAAGIVPRNGWIADYPVTPDIAGELQETIGEAADSGKLGMDANAALQVLQGALSSYGLSLTPDTSGRAGDMSAPSYPDSTAAEDYYNNEGPPAITYYAPPPDYAYMYDWVPYPFWWSNFWFSGFFVLTDFHKRVHWHHHGHERSGFVSNHFRDPKTGGTSRVDPANRFSSGTSRVQGGIRWSRPSTQSGAQRSSPLIRPAPMKRYRGYGVMPNNEGVRSSVFEHSVNRRVEHHSSDRGYRSRSSAGQVPVQKNVGRGVPRGGGGTYRSGGGSGSGFHGGGRR